jgi:hypothetical protein
MAGESSLPREVPPPGWAQFRLRTLLGVVAVFSALFALMGAIGPLASLALVLFVAMIIAHIGGNALGTRLRDHASRQHPPCLADAASLAAARQGGLTAARLQQRTPLGKMIVVASGLGGLAGAAAGGALLVFWIHVTLPGAAVGTLCSGIIGGFLGFLAGSFLEIAHDAWREAAREPSAASVGRHRLATRPALDSQGSEAAGERD